MNTKLPVLKGEKGFSLVELLVVIAVIAIIAAIAIPNIANITEQARITKLQRNSQTVVNVATSAIAAGYNPGEDWNVQADLINSITSGTVRVTRGDKTMMFKISEINPDDYAGMEAYIRIVREGTTDSVPIIDYDPAGTNQ